MTPSEPVAALIVFITEAELDRREIKPLTHPLQAVMKDLDHCHAKSAIQQLREFQKKLEKIGRSDPALAAQLLAAAQAILDAVDEDEKHGRHHPPRGGGG